MGLYLAPRLNTGANSLPPPPPYWRTSPPTVAVTSVLPEVSNLALLTVVLSLPADLAPGVQIAVVIDAVVLGCPLEKQKAGRVVQFQKLLSVHAIISSPDGDPRREDPQDIGLLFIGLDINVVV